MATTADDKTSIHSSIAKHDLEKSPDADAPDARVEDVTGAPVMADPFLDRDHLVLEDDSPYPEVRSAVSNTDDPSMPVTTIRSCVIGFIWAMVIPGLNQFFYFRYPAVTVNGLVAQLISFPIGRAWAYLMPRVKIFGVELNPGPFNVKEHVIITIMATVGYQSAYATDIVAVQRVFYGQTYNFGFQWMMVMSTQLIGFSIGGVCKRFLVDPPAMIWPTNLVQCALFNTLHSTQYQGIGERGGISRERFFTYALIAIFCWEWLPTYIFTALGYFSWMSWIAPTNVVLNNLTGFSTGLGMSLITFDWSQITYIGNPLASPWWATANVSAGFVLFVWVITPAIYYTNTWYTAYLPPSTGGSFDNTGASYNVSMILNDDFTFNREKYSAYSPLFLSATFALNYGVSFASITATLMHTFLYYRKQLWTQTRRALADQPDIHGRLMSHYKAVPQWWYLIVFLSMFAFGVAIIEVLDTKLPVWAFCVALVIAFFYTIPIGIIQAITNQQIGLNVITELIIGYMLPGRPIAMMLFKTWGYITMAQALQFTSDFKLGHYMKIPPRKMFWCQVIASIVALTTQLGVQAWMFQNIKDICDKEQVNGFSCPNTRVFGTASIIWGVIGPGLLYSGGKIYNSLMYFFLAGAIAPIVPYLLAKRFPNGIWKYINIPVVLAGIGLIPPANALNYVPWCIVGFIFNFVIRRRHFNWWTKYNYVLAAALDSGTAIAIIIIFFCLQYPRNGTIGADTIAKWWGNTVYMNTADWNGTAYLPMPDSGMFGPPPGSW